MTTAGSRLLAGRYQVGKLLGTGGMGRVWLARDVVLDRDVAIKEIQLPTDLAAQERDTLQRRTLREARAAARLTHPNVAQVYDVFEVDGRPWIVMEYVPARSLQQVLDTEGAFEPRRVAEVGLEVLAALQAAHRAGVRHRDVKPSNVLLADDGRVVLTDFGIASIEGDSITTSSDQVLGSPQFMAPERALRGDSSPTSDLWSLAATLYAAVEGRPPYQRPTTVGTLMALAADEPEPPRRAGVLRPVLDGLLRKDPNERIDADEARRRLRKAAGLKGPAAEDLRWNRPFRSAAAADLAEPTPASAQAATAAPSVAPGPGRPPLPDEAFVDFTATESGGAPARTPTETEPTAHPGPASTKGRLPRRWIVVLALVLVALAGTVAVVLSMVNRSSPGSAASSPGAAGPRVSSASPDSSANGPSAGTPTGATSSGTGSAGTASSGTTAGGVNPGGTGPDSAGPDGTGPDGRGPRPVLPSGWVDYHDRTGFSVFVPKGWTKSQDGSIVYFRGAGRVLGIDQTAHPNMNPVADWRGKADYRVARGDFPGYHEIHIQPVSYFEKAADWEFTFAGSTARQHVNNRGLVVNRHQAYGIYWQTPDSRWQGAYPDLQLIFSSFRPRG